MRTKRNLTLSLVAVALLALLVPAMALSQPAPPPPNDPGQSWMPRMHEGRQALIEKLDLSEEQQTKLADLRLEHHKAQTLLRGDLASASSRLEALLLDPEASRDEVLKAGETVSSLRAKAATQRLAQRMDVRALLTPTQRAELVQMQAQRQSMRQGGRGHHGGGWGHHRGGCCGGDEARRGGSYDGHSCRGRHLRRGPAMR